MQGVRRTTVENIWYGSAPIQGWGAVRSDQPSGFVTQV
jgi:hypothetical protein